MRLKILTLTLAIGVIAVLARHAQAAGDPISGEWDVSFLLEGSTTPATFTLTLADGKLTGTVYSHHTGAGTLRDGAFKDNRLAGTLDFSSHESIAITGELKDGEMTGEFRTEGRVGKWEGRKKGR